MTRRKSAPSHSAEPALATALTTALTMMLTNVPLAQTQPRLPGNTVVQTSVPERQASTEDSFRLQVRDEVQEWHRQMQAFDEKTKANSQRHISAAEPRLRTAWDETEVEARNVQTATARDWAGTKRAYEAPPHRMALAWDEARL